MNTSAPFWAIAYHAFNLNPRARKWYRVSRLIEVDGRTFELYWHDDPTFRGHSITAISDAAKTAGVELAPGIYRRAAVPRGASEMERAS